MKEVTPQEVVKALESLKQWILAFILLLIFVLYITDQHSRDLRVKEAQITNLKASVKALQQAERDRKEKN